MLLRKFLEWLYIPCITEQIGRQSLIRRKTDKTSTVFVVSQIATVVEQTYFGQMVKKKKKKENTWQKEIRTKSTNRISKKKSDMNNHMTR